MTSSHPSRLILNHCALFDGASETLLADRCLIVENGRIAAIEAHPLPGGLDMAGCTVLPGFVHAHCHPGFKLQAGQDLPAYDAAYMHAALDAGITTIRDMGALNASTPEDVLAARDAHNRRGDGPRLLSPGKFLAAPGGYGGAAPLPVDSPKSAAEAVRRLAGAGADFIKTSLEWGMDPSTYGLPVLSAELLRAICDAAHTEGLRVSAHATQAQPLRTLVEAGLDDAAHVPYEPMDDALIADMVARGVTLTPTLSVHRMIAEKYGAPVLGTALDNVRRFHMAGGTLAVGDDFLEEEAPWFLPGLPWGELELLAQAGLSNAAILRALTHGGAAACGRAHEIGALRPGIAADLVAVHGYPLRSLECLKAVVMVVLGGRIVRRSSALSSSDTLPR